MNNNLYSWHNEVMVSLAVDGLKREIENIRLIRDAGLSNPGLLERLFIAIGNFLVKKGQNMRKAYVEPHQAYELTSGKLAS
jgi:hypothetical protein